MDKIPNGGYIRSGNKTYIISKKGVEKEVERERKDKAKKEERAAKREQDQYDKDEYERMPGGYYGGVQR